MEIGWGGNYGFCIENLKTRLSLVECGREGFFKIKNCLPGTSKGCLQSARRVPGTPEGMRAVRYEVPGSPEDMRAARYEVPGTPARCLQSGE